MTDLVVDGDGLVVTTQDAGIARLCDTQARHSPSAVEEDDLGHRSEAVGRAHRLEISAGVERRDDVALLDRRHRVVLGEHVTGLVDVAGHGDDLGPRRVGRAADDELLREPVDEIRAVDVPADVEPDERDAASSLDGDDLAEQDRRVLGQQIAGLAGDRDPERTEVTGKDGRVGVEVDRSLVLPRRRTQPAADVDLGDRMTRRAQPRDRFDGRRQGALEAGEPIGQPARAGVEMDRVDRQVVARAAAAIASSSRSSPIPNFVGRSPAYSRCSL